MAYFQYFSQLRYPSLSQVGDDYEYTTATNLFRRGKIRDDIFDKTVLFNKYSIQGDDRPDNVAYKVYGDSQLDWIVLMSNNIINIRDEWPMTPKSFENYMSEKYPTNAERYAVKHYVTPKILGDNGQLIRPENVIISPESYDNYQFQYLTKLGVVTETNQVLLPVTYDDYERELNENKRQIYLIKEKFISTIIKDMEKIMKYDQSSQFVSKKIKKTLE